MRNKKQKAYPASCYLGGFDFEHKNPPPPFNPEYDPEASHRFQLVTASMKTDGYYEGHTRAECQVEWRKRYDALKKSFSNNIKRGKK